MSFFSRSSSGKHHKKGHYGSGHYKNNGIFGKIFGMMTSRSRSHYYNDNKYNEGNSNKQPQSGVVCKKCGIELPEGAKFCLNCGEKVNSILFCTGCGEKLPQNAKFCSKCGEKTSD